jgi:hypothetical protein
MTTLNATPGRISLLAQTAAQCETVQQIIDIAATAEALDGQLALNDEQIQFLKASRAAEQAHYEVLVGAGAKPLTLTFTVPDPRIVTDVGVLLTTAINLEEAFIAAYLAAAQEFAILGQPDLVKLALQIGGVEAEHRAHLRFYAIIGGVISGVPNNVAFEKSLFTSVGAAAEALVQLGFIGGDGPEITYPGPGEIDYSGVTQLRP